MNRSIINFSRLKFVSENETLRISETFTSLQGEGLHMGLPCFFIRLAGCNLHCRYCDTEYARSGGTEEEISALIDLWKDSRVSLVQVTGGEPLLQPGVYPLMEGLLDAGASVLLETNGSVPLNQVPWKVVKVVDIKTPGSGMEESWHEENLRWLAGYDQLKFVLTSRQDYEWACSQVRRLNLNSYCNVLFSAAWNTLPPSVLADWIVEDRMAVRFQLQLHKVLWGEKTAH